MITCILFVSRLAYLSKVFECLNNLKKPEYTELILVIDSIDKPLLKYIEDSIDNLAYSNIKIIYTGNIAPMNSVADRRYRISELHNKVKHEISEQSEYVYLHEDDTLCEPNALIKMFDTMKQTNCAYIEGVQLGRHNAPYVGAWYIDDFNNPSVITSVLPHTEIIHEIDAGGFYCALTDAELYKMHHFEPFDKLGTNGLSCDVNYGLYLRQQGYKCLIDWDIQCDHIGERGSVNIGNTKPCQVQFKKGKDDKWTCVRV